MTDAPQAFSCTTTDWRATLRRSRTPAWKRGIYTLVRPLLGLHARAFLPPEARRVLRPRLVLFERGFPVEDRRQWATQGLDLHRASVLVQGTGTGWDAVTWAERRPARIVATDLYEFAAWREIRDFCRSEHGVAVEFRQAPLERLDFLPDASVDLCVSDAVYEHCRTLAGTLAETYRVLKPGGRVYASFGPLWFAPGGDHFSGRGGLEHAYAHVALDPAEYRRYFEAHLRAVEDAQEGARYVELDLFSKLRAQEYLAAFAQAGFEIEDLVVELSSEAIAFRRRFPERWRALLARLAGRCESWDPLVKGILVLLRKPARA